MPPTGNSRRRSPRAASNPAGPPKLPDEVIQRIFEDVFEPRKSAAPAGPEYLPATEYLVLSKHYYRLLRPIRYRSMSTRSDPRRAATLLGRLAADSETRTWLKKLVLHVLPDFTAVHAFALSQFTNLTELKAHHGRASIWSSVPEDVSRSIWHDLWTTIARLPRLEHFICHAPTCRDPILHLPPSPSLKMITLAFNGVSPALSSLFNSSGVTDLCLFTGDAAAALREDRRFGKLPWQSLRRLKIYPGNITHSGDIDAVLIHMILEVRPNR